jgi:hypothetical protein
MQQNINPYNEKKFKSYFEQTEICHRLKQDFDDLYYFDEDIHPWNDRSPRQHIGTRKFFAVPFYYLKYLTDRNPKVIYDIGCGWNIFKKYIPNIIGIDNNIASREHHADVYGDVNDNYIQQHQNFFESAFAICSLHFHPLSELRQVVLDFISMLAPDGCGFISFNLQRMIERDPRFANNSLPNFDFETEIRTQLENVPATYLVFDVNLSNGIAENMNGNIRLVCHKTT